MTESSQGRPASRDRGRRVPAGSDGPAACIGVDGCRGGWAVAVAVFDPAGGAPPTVVLDVVATFVDVLACLPRDRKASVFSPPVRPALGALTWDEARQRNGGGLSIQTFHLLPRLREVDAAMTPALQRRVFEAHPELAFLALADGQPLPPKKTAAGRAHRQALLRRVFGAAIDTVGTVRARHGARQVQVDDLLDALVLAVVAARVRGGRAVCLPAGDSAARDARGLEMRIRF
jgi:predicted RNase H-like nuclease